MFEMTLVTEMTYRQAARYLVRQFQQLTTGPAAERYHADDVAYVIEALNTGKWFEVPLTLSMLNHLSDPFDLIERTWEHGDGKFHFRKY
jgi:hypothetical protein